MNNALSYVLVLVGEEGTKKEYAEGERRTLLHSRESIQLFFPSLLLSLSTFLHNSLASYRYLGWVGVVQLPF